MAILFSGGVFVGDCMPYAHDGRYHILYLKSMTDVRDGTRV